MNTILVDSAEREDFIQEFIAILNGKLVAASERKARHFNVYVAEWKDCKRTLKQTMMCQVPDECNMSQEARWVMEYLRSQKLTFHIAACGGVEFRSTNWGIFVHVPPLSKEEFLAKWSKETATDIERYRKSGFTSKNVLRVDYDTVPYTWKEWFLGYAPSEEVMPTEAQWAMEWLRDNHYCYRISKCGANITNWGIFADLHRMQPAQ